MALEAVVLFEYEKQQDDELSLKVGEVILDVKQADEGWCEGMLNGARGMFPDNFVQVRPASSSKPPAPAPEAAPAPMPSEQHSADMSSSVSRASKKARRAKVTYSYVAENPDELNLQPGQVVDIVEEEEEGWWKGRVDGREGLFPSNFVEMIDQNGSTTSSDPIHDYSVPAPVEKPPAVDHSMPRDRPEEPAPPRQSVLGPKLFPAFNPVEARSKLKATPPATKSTPQPPSTADRRLSASTPKKPAPPSIPTSKGAKAPALPPSAVLPSHPEKPPIKPPEKQVERAKVLFNYTAEQPDELSIKIGEVLEVVSKDVQEGWWEVRQGDQKGLIPDNFVELLPPQPAQPQQPSKPKPPAPSTEKTEPPPHPSAKAAPLPPPGKKPSAKHAAPQPPKSTEPPPPHATEESDFGVPTTTPLDTSALKNRPRNPEPEKPPEESPNDSSKLPPWQKELKARKAKVPLPPSKAAVAKPPPATKPPPAVKPEPESKPKPAPAPSKPPTAKPAASKPTPPPSTPSETEPVADNAWKEAFDKLKAELDRFRKEVRREVQILTDDLDKERKIRAELQIDIDRLKKAREFRDNL